MHCHLLIRDKQADKRADGRPALPDYPRLKSKWFVGVGGHLLQGNATVFSVPSEGGAILIQHQCVAD